MKNLQITPEIYQELNNQLSSEDRENHTMALLWLNNCRLEGNLPYILLLYRKYYPNNSDKWKEDAKNLISRMEKAEIPLSIDKLEYTHMAALCRKYGYPKETINRLIFPLWAEDIRDHLIAWGDEEMKHTYLTINYKE